MRFTACQQLKLLLSVGKSGRLWWTVYFFWLFLATVRDYGWAPAAFQRQRLPPPDPQRLDPNTLSLQITAESLMQFWPDFDAALHWCGVTPQQSSKVRAEQWRSRSPWAQVCLPPLVRLRAGAGPAPRAPAAGAHPARGGQDACSAQVSCTPLGKIIPARSAAEQSSNQSVSQSVRKSDFGKHRPRQPGGGRRPWVQVRVCYSGGHLPLQAGGANQSSPCLFWNPWGHLWSPSGRARQGGSGPALTEEPIEHQSRPRLILPPWTWGWASAAGLELVGLCRLCTCQDTMYILCTCI